MSVVCRRGSIRRTWRAFQVSKLMSSGLPRDELLLRQSDPTKKGKETYELGVLEAQEDYFIAVRLKGGAIASDDENQFYLRLPFDRRRIAWTRKFKFNPKVQPEEASDGTAEPSARLKAVYER